MKVLVTPRSFAKHNTKPYDMLIAHGFEVVRNPFQRPMNQAELEEHIADVDGVIIGIDPLNRNVLEKARKLKAIAKYGVGIDNIDVEYAKSKNIKISRTLGANFEAVADYTFTLILSIARKVHITDRECRQGNWHKLLTLEVFNKTLGIIGTGHIGQGVAKRAKGFDMKILAYDLHPDLEFANKCGVEYVDLNTLYKRADIITLHLPLTPETRNMIGENEFNIMKNTAIVINTARGGLIDETALYNALETNTIYGAGIDVFEQEPPLNQELMKLDNIIISPHSAASTFDAVDKMGTMSVENLIRDLT